MAEKTNIIIVSDLHIDTWDQSGKFKGKTKEEHFLDFLEQKKATTRSLYIVGDLLDLPPERGRDAFPTGGAVDRVLTRLIELSRQPDTFVVYVIGNHDIGLSGLRVNRSFEIPWMGRIAISYPRVHIGTQKGSILLEHGHFYDPSLVIYAGDLLWTTYFGEAREQPFVHISSSLVRSLQRRDSVTGKKIREPGELKPIPRPPIGCREQIKGFIKRLLRRPLPVIEEVYKPLHWQNAAKEVLREYNESVGADERARVIIFGHTHRPDKYVWDTGEQYFNSGDWSGDSPHSTYLEVDEDGNIFDHDWIKELL
jgi:UDP-2,3-diacylglucosamine pyrophosphatase LpxH